MANSVAFAGSFRVSPVRIFLDEKSETAVLKITNQGEEKVTVQLDAKTWRQDENGKDVYEAEGGGDIVFFPKIAEIEKGRERIVRIGFRGKRQRAEGSYRLFLQELPISKPGETALKLAINMSIPVFIGSEKAVGKWDVEPGGLSEESVRARVRNTGTRHIVVSRLKAAGFDETGAEVFSKDAAGWYTLPGAIRTFAVSVPQEDCLKLKSIRVSVETEDREKKDFTMDVINEMCTRKPAAGVKKNKERSE